MMCLEGRKDDKDDVRFTDCQPDADGALEELNAGKDGQAPGSATDEFAEIEQSAAQDAADTEETSQDQPADDRANTQPDGQAALLFKTALNQLQKFFAATLFWIKRCYFTALNGVYTYFYFVGVQLLRSTRVKRRHLLYAIHRFERKIKERQQTHKRSLAIYMSGVWRGMMLPFRDFRARYKEFRKAVQNARYYHSGRRMFDAYKEMGGFLLGRFFHLLKVIFNYAAPIAGAVLLFTTIHYFNNLTLALQVEYNGKSLGYISDEAVFNRAENEMKARIINETYIKPDDVIPKFELTVVDAETLITADELTDKLIQASGNALEEANGLYIQNRFISAVTDGDGLLLHMNEMLERHRTEDMSSDARLQFVKKIQIKNGLYPVSSIKPLEEVTTMLEREEKGERRYTVVLGDDGLKIASKNGISFRELKALNPEVDVKLMPGDELLISQSVPYLGVQATTTIRYEEEMPYKITQKTDASQNVGWTKVTQKGEEGLVEITAEIKMIDGIEIERNVVDRKVLVEPVDQILVVGGNKPLKVIPNSSAGSMSSGAFAWPAAGGSITTGFLGYYGHTGSDITWSGCYGGEVYASADGVVVASGWGGAYGNRIIINHGGNVQTLYAHCSKLVVGVGTQVKQGDLIGYIGRTGNVTGPHLHFEIRVNGRQVNAAPYLYG